MREVVFGQMGAGQCPVQEFLDSLPGRDAQQVLWVLSLLEEPDALPVSCFKKLHGSEEIWECRIQFGSAVYRIFCFFPGRSLVVLTHGMRKKAQKTPRREIERAEECRRDYLRRKS